MQPPKTKITAAEALVGMWNVLLTAFVIATLYFARDLLIPLALAALLTFLLAPLVRRLERWMGRIGAVLLVVATIFSMIGMAGWVLTRQLVDLATRLPDYKVNIETKIHSFQLPSGGAFKRLSETVEELKKDLSGSDAPTVSQASGKPTTAVAVPARASPTLPVQVVETSKANPLQLLQVIISPLLGPLGTIGLVILLVIFMLLKREDLRSRLIRLIGQGRISDTTRALDDAGRRVSRYLLMQLLVNVTYGIAVAIGISFLGVPNAILWGAFATLLRFIPYIGPWIAAAFPIILSLAVSPSWMTPLLTLGLFVVLELISSNVAEPWLYGSSTGVSSFALIVAAVFWTWLWGPIGLLLATPLTVCPSSWDDTPTVGLLSALSDEEALPRRGVLPSASRLACMKRANWRTPTSRRTRL
jgi:predicted PurR-regulated permease PerM